MVMLIFCNVASWVPGDVMLSLSPATKLAPAPEKEPIADPVAKVSVPMLDAFLEMVNTDDSAAAVTAKACEPKKDEGIEKALGTANEKIVVFAEGLPSMLNPMS